MSELNIEYLQLVTRHQAAICGYIRSIAPGVTADDVLQETNIVLWEKAGEFEPGTNFKAYAFRIAHFKTLEALRAQKRDHWLQFDSDILESIARHQVEVETDQAGRQHALRQCMTELDDEQRRLIHLRYTDGQTVRQIAEDMQRSEGALQQLYFRLRNALRQCIERKLIEEGGPA
ncbi:MAG: sigma-70 family RNA polymerase sigma factor [Akkermansiaceae bacterium]|nr:sigma-70 family RNA polymerase sigma factor [Akkermansiaceae bacterium]